MKRPRLKIEITGKLALLEAKKYKDRIELAEKAPNIFNYLKKQKGALDQIYKR
jgi:hypothetical protein